MYSKITRETNMGGFGRGISETVKKVGEIEILQLLLVLFQSLPADFFILQLTLLHFFTAIKVPDVGFRFLVEESMIDREEEEMLCFV